MGIFPKHSILTGTNHADAWRLFEIFPQEVWDRILANVQCHSDYIRITNTSQTFNTLLSSHRVRLLIGAVFPFLKGHNQRQTYIEVKDLLNIRLACRTWRFVIDNFLENLSDHFCFQIELSSNRYQHYTNRDYFHVLPNRQFEYLESSRFCSEFENTHFPHNRNPFVGRSIRIVVTLHRGIWPNILQDLLKMLHKYGSHLWYCHLHVYLTNQAESVAALDRCKWIRDILVLLPSLRKLSVLFEDYAGLLDMGDMEDFWTSETMPTLANLTMITEIGLFVPVLNAILKANPQIKTLETKGLHIDRHLSEYEPTFLQNLETLAVIILNLSQRKTELTFGSWLLMKLSIRVEDFHTADLNRVLMFAQTHFGNTLQELNIILSESIVGKTVETPLRMPKLKTFHLRMMHFQALDYLLPLSSTLETLILEIRDTISCFGTEKHIMLFDHRRHLERSNIWQLLTKLCVLHYLEIENGIDKSTRRYTCSRSQQKPLFQTP